MAILTDSMPAVLVTQRLSSRLLKELLHPHSVESDPKFPQAGFYLGDTPQAFDMMLRRVPVRARLWAIGIAVEAAVEEAFAAEDTEGWDVGIYHEMAQGVAATRMLAPGVAALHRAFVALVKRLGTVRAHRSRPRRRLPRKRVQWSRAFYDAMGALRDLLSLMKGVPLSVWSSDPALDRIAVMKQAVGVLALVRHCPDFALDERWEIYNRVPMGAIKAAVRWWWDTVRARLAIHFDPLANDVS